MKGILCACLLAMLHSTAQAYEADIHYSTTYALARAAGWTGSDALIIASANQAMDENHDTVAALEVDTPPGASLSGYVMRSLRQAEKNLEFHCFSNTHGSGDEISADVRKVIAGHFAEIPGDDADPRNSTRRLIALGVALHCQQDAYSHAGFGGSCGPYSGSCYGHTHQTLLDQLVFSVLKRHHYNPDHPGVSGERLLDALRGTADELTARAPRASSRTIPSKALAALSENLRASGLELPDEVRRECNRHIAGKWLHDFFPAAVRGQKGHARLEELAPEVAGTCKNASLASATIARIPEARFPRLDSKASPYQVRADGTYQSIRGGSLEGFSTTAHHHAHEARLQWSHWSQLLAFPLTTKVALFAEGSTRKVR